MAKTQWSRVDDSISMKEIDRFCDCFPVYGKFHDAVIERFGE